MQGDRGPLAPSVGTRSLIVRVVARAIFALSCLGQLLSQMFCEIRVLLFLWFILKQAPFDIKGVTLVHSQ